MEILDLYFWLLICKVKEFCFSYGYSPSFCACCMSPFHLLFNCILLSFLHEHLQKKHLFKYIRISWYAEPTWWIRGKILWGESSTWSEISKTLPTLIYQGIILIIILELWKPICLLTEHKDSCCPAYLFYFIWWNMEKALRVVLLYINFFFMWHLSSSHPPFSMIFFCSI